MFAAGFSLGAQAADIGANVATKGDQVILSMSDGAHAARVALTAAEARLLSESLMGDVSSRSSSWQLGASFASNGEVVRLWVRQASENTATIEFIRSNVLLLSVPLDGSKSAVLGKMVRQGWEAAEADGRAERLRAALLDATGIAVSATGGVSLPDAEQLPILAVRRREVFYGEMGTLAVVGALKLFGSRRQRVVRLAMLIWLGVATVGFCMTGWVVWKIFIAWGSIGV